MINKKLVFAAACAGMLLFGICLITLGSVAPDINTKFGLNGEGSGTLFSILPLGIMLGSLLFGPIVDRYGYKHLLLAACLGMFAGFEGIAYSPGPGLLKASVFLFGLGGGIINGAANAVVSDISEFRKGATLSLLGVFFGLGALGMPLVLGMLTGILRPLQALSAVGGLTLAVGVFYSFIRFPAAKLPPRTGIVPLPGREIARDRGELMPVKMLFSGFLLLIAFFLFCQSSLEAIVNNWTTTYLVQLGIMNESGALYALSLHVSGMILMRLLSGSVFRSVSPVKIMGACLVLLAAGFVLMQAGKMKAPVVAGLVLSGAGLAEGFPIMLGFVGERFARLSGTAFSVVFVIALIGNMLVNYTMGIVVHHYGIAHLTTACFFETGVMAILFILIVKKLNNHPPLYVPDGGHGNPAH